jgi:DNA-binding GntR family transcriptional regulator
MRKYAIDCFWKKVKVNKLSPKRRRGLKTKDSVLYAKIKKEIMDYRLRYKDCNWMPVRAEAFANEHQVVVHRITEIFKRLNQEGLMTQRFNERTDHRWRASTYYVKLK